MNGRIVFTFGTLYEDRVIEALLGRIPDNFYATLPAYAIYKAGFSQLPPKAKEFILTKDYDTQSFSFLFLKPENTSTSTVSGRTYRIKPSDELALDRWENYPDWYEKQPVEIQDSDGIQHEAIIYFGNFEGEKLQRYQQVVSNAAKARAEVVEKYPETFA
jgi:gamma-glutamylcyclotransferase (GGCT)/AIG2-like uncharacterized protein YtfP